MSKVPPKYDVGELPGRPGYTVELESRFDALEAELAALIAPWDSLDDVRRIAAARGTPVDAQTAERAMELCREAHVPNEPGVTGWGPS